MNQQVNIRLPVEMCNRLDYLSQKTGRTRSFYVKKAVMEQIEEMEDLYLAMSELEASKGQKNYTLNEVVNELGMAD